MPDVTGGLARMAVVSAAVAGAVLGVGAPPHAADREAPVSAAHGVHERAAVPAESVVEEGQGRQP